MVERATKPTAQGRETRSLSTNPGICVTFLRLLRYTEDAARSREIRAACAGFFCLSQRAVRMNFLGYVIPVPGEWIGEWLAYWKKKGET